MEEITLNKQIKMKFELKTGTLKVRNNLEVLLLYTFNSITQFL